MFLYIIINKANGRVLDENGKFLLETFVLTLLLVGAWCYYLWDNKEMRKKYTGSLYVPEPWSVYSASGYKFI